MSLPMGNTAGSRPGGTGPDRAQAALGVLRAGDLPGWTGTPTEHDPTDDSVEADLYHCLGLTPPHFAGRDYGITYSKGKTLIVTSADVVGSARTAITTAQATGRPGHANCFANQITDDVEKAAVDVRALSVKPTKANVTGADEVFAFRVVADVSGPQGEVTVNLYRVDATLGQTEITISQIVTDAAPSPARVDALAALAVSRVKH
ncbi:MAG TPA: hypothetical protein VHU88_15450 [Sporichthyaceae bacterium]|jgi:hypothetical protein|nr:hypothetical protein [Sporichthyaceae bacterium]